MYKKNLFLYVFNSFYGKSDVQQELIKILINQEVQKLNLS